MPGVEVRRPFRLGDGVPAHPCRIFAARVSSRGGGRRAEPGLRTSRQKSPRPVYAPQGYRPQQKKKNNAYLEGPPHAQKLQQRAKKRRRASPCGGGRRAEPGLRTSTPKKACGRLCPAGVQPQKNVPAGAVPALKKVCRGSTVPVLGEAEKFFVRARFGPCFFCGDGLE